QASSAAQLPLGAGNHRTQLGVIKWLALLVANILENLGQRFEAVAKLRHRLIAALDHRQHLQRSNQPVAGRRVIRENDVTRRLATDIVPVRAHVLEHIAIADRSTHQFNAQAAEMTLEAKVGHHGRYHAGALEPAVFLPAFRNDGEQLIAIDHMAAFVNDQHAIGVTIKRDTDIGAHLPHLAANRGQIGGTAILVDVETIGINANGNDVRAELPERAGRNFICRAICAIDHNAETFERDSLRQGQLGELDVSILYAIDALRAPKVGTFGELLAEIGIKQILDLALRLVAELVAVRPEKLDPVVVER